MDITSIIKAVDDAVWGIPLIILIMVCGGLLTLRLGGLQIRRLGLALRFMVRNEEGGDGEVTSFGALCTALSATIGTGNIVGVATAVSVGGPGALFWMEIAAMLGMATKYAEGLLAIKFRTTDSEGHILGGPFYYIENGMGRRWRPLAKAFALFGVLAGLLGIGTITQINGITSAANGFFTDSPTVNILGMSVTVTTVITGLIVTICAAFVIIGGIESISKVSQIVVPFMAIAYVLCAVVIMVTHVTEIPAAVAEIVGGAFGVRPLAGAGAGGTIIIAMQKGVARGIFSNEAGLGSAPIAAAAAQTKEPVRQGLVTMTGTFIDTICICTMTGLSIVISGAWRDPDLQGVAITTAAFGYGLPLPERISALILMVCLIFFAFTTILGWSYYSERCLSYLFGGRQGVTKVYRWIYIAAVFAGPYLTVEAVWSLADIFNGLMAIPNVIALIALTPVTAAETKRYFTKKPIIAE
ncbi:alanine or glycine:cation symporter, AGCS family [Ruminococcus sp. YE71]|uniref:alanine/glycine:cation symporter family protein n=1 Tax=unclassified Ruminococcus TaxID=2608920 RepID=UPI000891E6B8|nr:MULTISPECIES: alanine/glycine:cation symporter family protein [unclassified Ruminococcus]SDA11742.1 alanine or glycine:cation symporter, AGCS family [Ruminococcus sp. YE78]SFW15687.1 alanine or glycine:cation symporter, AGCS family [Ruminococcus sp. YE71]